MNLGHILLATLFVAVMLTIIDKAKEKIKVLKQQADKDNRK